MRKIYNMDFEWKFKRQNSDMTVEIEDYFGMFNDNTKTGVEQGAKSVSFYDGDWDTVDLPHDWCLYEPKNENGRGSHGYNAQGVAWYRKSFIFDSTFFGKKVYLKFDGIAVESEIWINDIKIAQSSSAYTPITVDVTDFLIYGGYNVISVKCDNSVKEGWWYEGGGIYRHTYLIVCEQSHFADNGIFVKSEKVSDTEWLVSVRADIVNPDGCECVCEFEGKEYGLSFSVKSPELWSIENPKLYTVNAKLICNGVQVDEQKIKFGFREIRFDKDDGFFLNEKNIKLKGVCLHHDHACVGVAVPEGVIEYRLRKLRDMGCNAIRTSHNPQSPEFYDVCDRMGFLVMNEARHFSSTTVGLHELSELVKRDRNHPSVIMWSIYNEEPLQDTVSGELIAGTMKRVITELDDTRPVTGAMNGGPFGGEGVIKVVDVFGMNYLQYTYDKFHKVFPYIPFFGSENASYLTTRGITETNGMHLASHERKLYTNLLKWSATPGDTWREVEKRKFVAGCFSWTGFDYRGECTWPASNCNFGALDLCGFPKDAGLWYKVLWRDEPMIFIAPRWDFEEGSKVNITCYSNADEIELVINGEVIARYLNDKYDPKTIEVVYTEGIIEATGFIGGMPVCNTYIASPDEADDIAVDFSKCRVLSDKQDVVIADIHIEDMKGDVLDSCCDSVKITVYGGLKLLGVGNGDNTRLDSDISDTINLFNGYAQAIFISTGEMVDAEITFECANIVKKVVIPVDKSDIAPFIPSTGCRIPLMQWRRSDVVDYYPADKLSDMHFAWIPLNISLGNPFSEEGESGYCLVAIRYIIKTDCMENTFLNITGITGKCDIYINDKIIDTDFSGDLKKRLGRDCFGDSGCISLIFKTNGDEYGVLGEAYISFE